MESDRYKRGLEKLKEFVGHAGEKVVEALKDIAPDLARYVIEFGFGDIYSRGCLHRNRSRNWKQNPSSQETGCHCAPKSYAY